MTRNDKRQKWKPYSYHHQSILLFFNRCMPLYFFKCLQQYKKHWKKDFFKSKNIKMSQRPNLPLNLSIVEPMNSIWIQKYITNSLRKIKTFKRQKICFYDIFQNKDNMFQWFFVFLKKKKYWLISPLLIH